MKFDMVCVRRCVLFVAGVMLSLPACERAAGDTVRSNSWIRPHVLTISDGGDVNTLNPHLGQYAAVANLSEMTMAWLVKWDAHNRPYPELATQIPSKANGGVSRDGLTIRYHLRKGVRWADGVPFDAGDVAFSVHVVNDPANDEAGRFTQIARVETPDPYTVVFHLKKPYAPAVAAFFSSCCANPCLLPRHLLARSRTINDVPYNALPVGIGPFKFDRWDRGKDVVLGANPLYWRGRPKLEKIVYEIVPDHMRLLAALAAHDVGMWFQFDGAYLTQIAAMPGYAILRHPGYAYDHVDFNLSHAVVADHAVRQALRLALDRRALVGKAEHGIGVVQDSVTPAGAPYFTDAGTTAFDPERANAMLDGAGWRRGRDGIRAKRGIPLVLNVAARSGAPNVDAQIAIMRDDWRRVGADLRIRHYPPALMFAPPQRGGVVAGNAWDVVTFAWAADPFGDFSGIYGCDAFPPAGQNDLRWCDRAAQAHMDALVGHYDQTERNADVKAVVRAFVDDVPSIVTFVRDDLFAYDRRLRNFRPNAITPFDNMMDVDI